MESNSIPFTKGIVRNPSDILAQDGELAECINMITENSELKAVQPPRPRFTLQEGESLLYVHVSGTYRNYITTKEGQTLLFFDDADQTRREVATVTGTLKEIQSVGNTLMAITSDGIHYILFKDGTWYKYLGTHLPDIRVLFTYDGWFNEDGSVTSGSETFEYDKIVRGQERRGGNTRVSRLTMASDFSCGLKVGDMFWDYDYEGAVTLDLTDDNQKAVSDAVMAQVLKHVDHANREGMFLFPRLVRFALRLYDGNYTMYSAPFYVASENLEIFLAATQVGGPGVSVWNGRSFPFWLDYYIPGEDLELLKEWGDIVKGVSLFASQDVYPFDPDGKVISLDAGTIKRVRLPYRSTASQETEVLNTAAYYKIQEKNTDEYMSGYLLINVSAEDKMQKGEIIMDYTQDGTRKSVTLASIGDDEDLQTTAASIIEAMNGIGYKAYSQWQSMKELGQSQRLDQGSWTGSIGIVCIPMNGSKTISDISVTHRITTSDVIVDNCHIFVRQAYGMPVLSCKTPLSTLQVQKAVSDDYFTHNQITAGNAMTYNNRLILSDITRTPYVPKYSGIASRRFGRKVFNIWYYLKIDGTDVVIQQDVNAVINVNYLYYPDPRCYKAVVKCLDVNDEKTIYLVLRMIGNENATSDVAVLMNGSVCLLGLGMFYREYTSSRSGQTIQQTNGMLIDLFADGSVTEDPVPTSGFVEYMPNLVMRSEVNNPYFFDVKGYSRIGNGHIMKMATNVTALSASQFGTHPIFAFASDGVWAITVNNEGSFSSTQPVVRDVITNVNAVTQIDSGVTYVTQQGLKAIVSGNGTVAEVKSLSDILNGRHFDNSLKNLGTSHDEYARMVGYATDRESFLAYLQSCFIAYDYSDQRLIISDPSKPYQYAYSLDSATYAKICRDGRKYVSQANDYPSQLLVDDERNVYDLYGKQDVNTVTERIKGVAVTRPLSFDAAVSRKALMKLKILKHFTEGSEARIKIWGSDDLYHWYEKRSVLGSSYQYYTLALYTDMLPVDAVSGILAMTQRRMENKPR